MANSQLTKTNPTANTDSRKKGTISFWVKRSSRLTSTNWLYTEYSDSNNAGTIYFSSAGNLQIISYDSGIQRQRVSSAMKFRDTNAWYHICFNYDTTLATANDRQKLWVNGEEIEVTDRVNPTQNGNVWFGVGGTNYPIRIGGNGSSDYFDGYFAHFHRVDSQALDVSVFGQYDSTTGIWKPKTNPSITYTGTSDYNFFLDFADSSNLGNDISGENNDLSVSGNMTQTIDTPSNVFATLSPDILPRNSGETIKFGNLFFGTSSAIWNTESSAFGISKGKYYFEVKLNDNGSDRRFRWGLQKEDAINTTGENKVLGGSGNDVIGYATNGESSTQGSYIINQTATTMSDGDINVDGAIYGFAIDLDNQRMYGHMNGTYFHSGNPSAGTGGIDVSSFYTVGETLFPSFTVHNANIEINFGNGYFGTTAVASAGTNSGIGTFEYDVPTGFKALCTKSINEQEYS